MPGELVVVDVASLSLHGEKPPGETVVFPIVFRVFRRSKFSIPSIFLSPSLF